jgi:hypothetical protein
MEEDPVRVGTDLCAFLEQAQGQGQGRTPATHPETALQETRP